MDTIENRTSTLARSARLIDDLAAGLVSGSAFDAGAVPDRNVIYLCNLLLRSRRSYSSYVPHNIHDVHNTRELWNVHRIYFV